MGEAVTGAGAGGAARLSEGERRTLAQSFVAFFALLASYYLLRPVRDALGASLGADSIKYLSSTVFVVMLAMVPAFGWLVGRVRRSRLVPGLYAFFIGNLVLFAVAFADAGHGLPARGWSAAFYVWVTTFNLFAVSVFWSRMADVWSERDARRRFGVISAGGSLGGLLGPTLAHALATRLALAGLVWLSALLLAVSCLALTALPAGDAAPAPTTPSRREGRGELLAGLTLIARTPFLAGIAALVCASSFLGMVVYVEQARLVAATFPDAAARTVYYATRDQWVNGIALVLQFAVVGQVTRRLGVGAALVGAGLIVATAFAAVGFSPTLSALTVVNIVLRCTEFGLAKPARDMLYTVVAPAERYQAKNAIDTALYRAADMTSGWLQALVAQLGVGLSGWGWLGAGGALGLAGVAGLVGRGYRRRGGV